MVLRSCLVIACGLSSAYSCFASCSLSASTLQRIERLRRTQNSSIADFELGLAQVDTPACIDSAAATFRNLSDTDNNQQKHLAMGMLAVANARKLAQSGDRHAAIRALVDTASDYREFPAYLRAIRDLTLILQTQPNAPEWQFLAAQLKQIAATEDVAGMAAESVAQIAMHDIRTQHKDAGLTRMEQYLAKTHSVQIRLLSSILYLELLREAGYTVNVRILCRELDDDVGNMELDPSMRVRFLQACTFVYMSSADPQSQLRYKRFSDALARARSELQ